MSVFGSPLLDLAPLIPLPLHRMVSSLTPAISAAIQRMPCKIVSDRFKSFIAPSISAMGISPRLGQRTSNSTGQFTC